MRPKPKFAITSIVCIAPSLVDPVRERIDNNSTFTTVTDAEPKNVVPKGVALLCLPEWGTRDLQLTHIFILKKQRRVATAQVRLKGIDAIELKQVGIAELIDALPTHLQRYGRKAFSDTYTKISKKLGEALLIALLDLVPEQKGEILDLYESIVKASPRKRTERELDAAGERDALGLSLDIFGVNRAEILRRWSPAKGLGESFLRGLKEYKSYEDDVISYDLHNLPGWSAISEDITGVVEFENQSGEKLTVINANRKPLEKATGIDLIYFHRKYEAFTCVQYKMMDQFTASSKAYYNPNQNSHDEELSRMQDMQKLLNREKAGTSLLDYRFSNCAIFFKLCKKLELKNTEGSIAPGAYIPLNQWERLLEDPSIRGSRDGRQIGYHTLNDRYLRTSTFVQLVQYGYIGTQAMGSHKLAQFIEACIEQGRSVIYAIDRSALGLVKKIDDDEEENDEDYLL